MHVALRIPVLIVTVPGEGGVDVGAGQWLPSPVAAEGDPAEGVRRGAEFADRELDRPAGERVGEVRGDPARLSRRGVSAVQRDGSPVQTTCRLAQLIEIARISDRSSQDEEVGIRGSE